MGLAYDSPSAEYIRMSSGVTRWTSDGRPCVGVSVLLEPNFGPLSLEEKASPRNSLWDVSLHPDLVDAPSPHLEAPMVPMPAGLALDEDVFPSVQPSLKRVKDFPSASHGNLFVLLQHVTLPQYASLFPMLENILSPLVYT